MRAFGHSHYATTKRKDDLEMQNDDFTTLEIMQLIEQGGSFDFWEEDGEEIYSSEDGEAV